MEENYEFISFSNKKEEKEYMLENIDIIKKMLSVCYPPNSNKFMDEQDTKKYDNPEYDDAYYDSVISLFEMVAENNIFQWFFVEYENNIIGYCFCKKYFNIYNYKGSLKTYEKLNFPNTFSIESYNTVDEPLLEGLCKIKKYPHVGRFIIDNICKFYRKKGYEKLYLVPESQIYKNNYKGFVEFDQCVIDTENYKNMTEKLIKYYINNDFKISNSMCDLIICTESTSIALNVMYRIL